MKNFSISTICIGLILACGYLTGAFAQNGPLWDPEGNTASLRENINRYQDYSETRLRSLLTTEGKRNPNNIDMVFATYDFALLYHETGDLAYARKAAILLDEYANVFPHWPRDPGTSRGHSMWWEDWFHRDLGYVARYLPQAYDLIAHTGVLDENGRSKAKILQLFRSIVRVDLESYPLYLFNAAGTRPLGLFIFGRVLQDPELVHLAYWYYNKMIHYTFCYDGFTYEGTYDYGSTLYYALTMPEYKFYMNGYSDPPGFSRTPIEGPWDTPRIDNLNFENTFGVYYQAMSSALWHTSMPNDIWPVMNETSHFPFGYNNAKYHPYRETPESSRLLGGIGHIILANGHGHEQSQVRLDYSNSVSHSHQDALHLIYYNKYTEVVGGTGYADGDRDWNASSMNQNLVVVNGQEQDHDYWSYRTPSPYIPGVGKISELPAPNTYPNIAMHNNLLLYEAGGSGFDAIQLSEVDATPAYKSLALDSYQRFVAQIKIDDANEYLIDFFSVQGGQQYDWMLHGGHDDYRLEIQPRVSAASGTFGGIAINGSARAPQIWSADLVYANDRHKIIMLDDAPGTIFTGRGLRSRKEGGQQDYLFNRRQAVPSDMIIFKAIHETYTSSPDILAANKIEIAPQNGQLFGIEISLVNNTTDYVFYQPGKDRSTPYHVNINGQSYTVRGKFIHMRFQGSELKWIYQVNSELQMVNNPAVQGIAYELTGSIVRVRRSMDIDTPSAFYISSPLITSNDLAGRTLLVKWGNGWTWGYKIESVSGNIIYTRDDPGFTIENGRVNMMKFPVGTYAGPVTFSIAGKYVLTGQDILSGSINDRIPPTPPGPPNMHIRD